MERVCCGDSRYMLDLDGDKLVADDHVGLEFGPGREDFDARVGCAVGAAQEDSPDLGAGRVYRNRVVTRRGIVADFYTVRNLRSLILDDFQYVKFASFALSERPRLEIALPHAQGGLVHLDESSCATDRWAFDPLPLLTGRDHRGGWLREGDGRERVRGGQRTHHASRTGRLGGPHHLEPDLAEIAGPSGRRRRRRLGNT